MKKGAPKGARPRSGWVPEDARHTVRLLVRCPPELAERVRAVTAARKITLADVLAAGVEALS